MLTFLPMEEVERLSALEGAEINKAKEVLAFEVTKLVHGEEEAQKALDGARAAFSGGGNMANIPTTVMPAADFEGDGMGVVNLIRTLGLVPSNGEGFRTIEQGGLSIGGKKVEDKKLMVTVDMFEDGKLLIQKGKKKFHMVELG
jgi:tyrosyl-tRNA synthetase